MTIFFRNEHGSLATRTVTNYTSVSGTANADATVTLIDSAGNYARALRQGEHFFGELPVNNSTGAVCKGVGSPLRHICDDDFKKNSFLRFFAA